MVFNKLMRSASRNKGELIFLVFTEMSLEPSRRRLRGGNPRWLRWSCGGWKWVTTARFRIGFILYS